MALSKIENLVEDIRAGKIVILIDDKDPENASD